MDNVFFDNPPILRGEAEDQLQQLYRYMEEISGKLNNALMTITIEQMTPETKEIIYEGSKENQEQMRQSLKSMIIKTAEIVRNEMQVIRAQLHGENEYISEQFGNLVQNLDATITATAEGILQEYHITDRIQGLEEGTENFINRLNNYIYTGLIDPENLIFGIAIGEHVTRADGTLDTSGRMATFTKEELAFYQGTSKVAWFSSQTLHITEAVVTNSMTMGNHTWKVFSDGSMGLMAGGGT